MGSVMKRAPAMIIALQIICFSLSARAQSPGEAPSTSNAVPANALSNTPGMQRAKIRHDTPAQREAFLKQRLQQMQQQNIQHVSPLPAQRITPPHSQSQK